MSEPRTDQWDEIAAFLARGDAYTPTVAEIERLDTHISAVFLASDFAYKLKKPVKFPFLDFSTVELRRLACLNELRVNRANAPMLYLDVVPVTREASGALCLGGSGAPVEWLVKMRRFQQDQLYSHRAAAGQIDRKDIAALGETIARAHARADRYIEPGMAVAALAQVISENEEAFAEHPGVFPPAEAEALTASSRAMLTALTPLIEARTRAGFVRHCHGDLHLGNIVRLDDKPVLFDAVEFNDRIAIVDVLDDLAFLLMDLWSRGLDWAANQLMNMSVHERGGLSGLAGLEALPLYLSLRAAIRAKAAAYRAAPAEAGHVDREEARRYFDLARGFLEPVPPVLIGIGGFSGSGKTTLARALAPLLGRAPGAIHLRSDIERKRALGVAETERLEAPGYSAQITEQIYRTLRKKAAAALAAGQAVILDAVHARENERQLAEAVAKEAGVGFIGLWLEAPRAVLIERVSGRLGDASDATPEVIAYQLAHGAESPNWTVLQAGESLPALVAAAKQIIASGTGKTSLPQEKP